MKGSIIVLAMLLIGINCTGQKGDVNHISSERFKEITVKGTGTLLDVRTEPEFLNGHLQGTGKWHRITDLQRFYCLASWTVTGTQQSGSRLQFYI